MSKTKAIVEEPTMDLSKMTVRELQLALEKKVEEGLSTIITQIERLPVDQRKALGELLLRKGLITATTVYKGDPEIERILTESKLEFLRNNYGYKVSGKKINVTISGSSKGTAGIKVSTSTALYLKSGLKLPGMKGTKYDTSTRVACKDLPSFLQLL